MEIQSLIFILTIRYEPYVSYLLSRLIINLECTPIKHKNEFTFKNPTIVIVPDGR
ncbi:hypothetical protein AB3N58_07090 [Leptospira sp. WS60.C2]